MKGAFYGVDIVCTTIIVRMGMKECIKGHYLLLPFCS